MPTSDLLLYLDASNISNYCRKSPLRTWVTCSPLSKLLSTWYPPGKTASKSQIAPRQYWKNWHLWSFSTYSCASKWQCNTIAMPISKQKSATTTQKQVCHLALPCLIQAKRFWKSRKTSASSGSKSAGLGQLFLDQLPIKLLLPLSGLSLMYLLNPTCNSMFHVLHPVYSGILCFICKFLLVSRGHAPLLCSHHLRSKL